MKKGEVPELSKEEFIDKVARDDMYAKQYGELKHIYGEMWRRWPATDGRTVDQVQWVVDEIRRDPDCHNALVTAWNPEFLYDMAPAGKALRFPICHNMFQFNVKDGKLSGQLYQRTADMFLGVPFNIASYALLTVIIAKVTGYEPGEFIHTFGDAHIYDNHFDQVKEQLSRKPFLFPTLSIDDRVKEIDDFKPEHAILGTYEAHASIKAELSPTGGAKTQDWEDYLKKQKKKD
jgi:thymidylate synthase